MDLACCHDNWQDRYAHKDASGHNVDGMEDMHHNGNDDATKGIDCRYYVLDERNWKITTTSYSKYSVAHFKILMILPGV